jgi:hypothetical protein
MPLDDPSDLNAENRALKKRVERLEAGTGAGAGDSDHAGVGPLSTQVGFGALALLDQGTAMGFNSTVTGYNGTAYGAGSDSVDDGTAVGRSAHATGERGAAFGENAVADGYQSSALGSSTTANHDYSTALGRDATTTATNQLRLGEVHIEMGEITAPSAPAANAVRLFARDNGSGKTQLVALFASGSAIVIATQP